MGTRAILKSSTDNYLLSIAIVADEPSKHRRQYAIANKYANKHWLYLEMINDIDVLALIESNNNWSLIIFRVYNDSNRLVKVCRTKVCVITYTYITINIYRHIDNRLNRKHNRSSVDEKVIDFDSILYNRVRTTIRNGVRY